MKAFAALSLAAVASGKVYFQEDFKTGKRRPSFTET